MIYLTIIYGCVPNYMIYLTINLWMCFNLIALFDNLSMDVFITTWCVLPLSMDVLQTTWFVWPFIYGCVSNYMFYLTIYLWMCSKLYDLLNHLSMDVFQTNMIHLTIWMCSKLHDLLNRLSMDTRLSLLLSMDVFQTTGFTWPLTYGCVPSYMIYFAVYPRMSLKHYLLDYFSVDVFQTTWFTWPFI